MKDTKNNFKRKPGTTDVTYDVSYDVTPEVKTNSDLVTKRLENVTQKIADLQTLKTELEAELALIQSFEIPFKEIVEEGIQTLIDNPLMTENEFKDAYKLLYPDLSTAEIKQVYDDAVLILSER